MKLFKNGLSFNKIRQFSFVVEYVYLAYIGILIIRRYSPIDMNFELYSPLIIDMTIFMLYCIVLFTSGHQKEPTKIELIMRFLYLFMVVRLMVETQNPSVQIIIVLPTVIMSLRYSIKYTILTAFMTTFAILINGKVYNQFEFDYLFIFLSFIWVIGLLVNSSMEVERQMQLERSKLQEREKFAAIGQMAAGIAHEVRNPLTTIKGFVQLLYKYNLIEDVNKQKKYLQMIDKEIDRVNNLLKDFLQYARPIKPKLAMNNINDTIQDICTLIETHCTTNFIDLEVKLAPKMPNTLCDYDQIKQVVINIALNAIDAMQNSNTKVLSLATLFDQNNIYINIEDNGIGMTEEQIRRIFDPFYSTKENGTGLGLSVCYSIIEKHRGRIEVSSKLNNGTVFSIVLPRFN